jgi:ribose-phosphate pyrophosphokinase
MQCDHGSIELRDFPDGESYVKIDTPVRGRNCLVVIDLSFPNKKYLPLLFVLETLRELGAMSIGLVAPYLCYMRQDKRFENGEAVTSRLFAQSLSRHIDWLVTVDPHLHRYSSLDQVYRVPSRVVQAAPAISDWLSQRSHLLLVGPDSESEQWVSAVAAQSGHPYVIGEKHRYGDRDVQLLLPDVSKHSSREVVVIDDIISTGTTILQCISCLRKQGVDNIHCAAVHAILPDSVIIELTNAGLRSLNTSNTIPHETNTIDMGPPLVEAILVCLQQSIRAHP